MPTHFNEIIVRKPEDHNPHCLIIEGIFGKENGEPASLTYYKYVNADTIWGHEYYSGPNYVSGCSGRSYSRNWKHGKGMPKKYKEMAKELKNFVTHI